MKNMISTLSVVLAFAWAFTPSASTAEKKGAQATGNQAIGKTIKDSIQISKAAPLKRLDPHGAPDADLSSISIEKQSECKVCHFMKAGKLQTKEEPDQVCASCHGALPHSGVTEHNDASVTCLGCHDPHRATTDGSPRADLPAPSFLKLQRDQQKAAGDLPKGLIDRPNSKAMIGHPCSECHDFN